MTEIQGKSIFVRVSARFELARVRVIGSRLYFHGKIETTESLQKLPMVPPAWNRDISPLPLKPPKSFKPWNTIRIRFVFLWIWPERVMGRQRQENFQKTSWKAKKNFFSTPSAIFVIFQTCFQSSLTVLFFLFRVCFFIYNCHGKKTKH